MSDHDIETEHRKDGNDQITTKRVHYQGDVYKFEGEPNGEYEYVGEGSPPVGAVDALQAHFGEDSTVADDQPETGGEAA